MPPKPRKISDLTIADAKALLVKLEQLQSSLYEGDENLPPGLIEKLQELRNKLEDVTHISFSKVDPITLVSIRITSGPLFLIDAKRQEIEQLGQSEVEGCLSMEATRSLILLVRGHVSTMARDDFHQSRPVLMISLRPRRDLVS
jgi:hypothetical protein